ncbi:MAG: tetratricopeptide repeat protein [Candidatus Gracilibacteria bacterium]|jgi:tetratricopeptide (TPR) repeat protein
MLAWLLLITSGLSLLLIFFRRLRMTQKDLIFQETLDKEEEEAVEEATQEEEFNQAEVDDEKTELLGSVRKTFLTADTHMSRKEFDEAEPLLLAVIDAEPNHLEAHHKLGLLFMKQGDFGQAELYFSKLVNLKQDPVYFSNLGAALYQQQRLVEAAEAYENAIALDDKRGERLQSLGQVYFELGEDDKALHYFERAARRKPKDIELKLILADYYERLVRLDEAIDTLGGILELDPYNEEVKKRLRLLKKKAGE